MKTVKVKRNLTTEQKIVKLLQSHPLMSTFVMSALLEKADVVMAQDKSPWPENSWLSWDAWQGCAREAQDTFGQKPMSKELF